MTKKRTKAKTTRRLHTPEFRAEALALADKVGAVAAARDLKLHASQIYGWRSNAQAQRNRSEVEQDQAVEIAKLKRQLANQEEELAILKKRQRISLSSCEDTASVKYEFISEHRSEFTLSAMSRVLDVSRSGFYAWRSRQPSRVCREASDEALDALVNAAFFERKERSGSPGLTLDLADAGHTYNRKTIAKSMKRQDLRAKAGKKFKVTTDSNHTNPVAPNLLNRDFSATVANQKWVSDITYLWTDEGWLYLAVVIDLYSRKVVGWSMAQRMTTPLISDALTMALWRRGFPKGVLVHSDRGSQYCSADYQTLLKEHELVCSMSRTGNCWDNACAESFFHTLKVELVHGERFSERSQMRESVFEYIEVDYNRKRRHSAVGMISPDRFEALKVA